MVNRDGFSCCWDRQHFCTSCRYPGDASGGAENQSSVGSEFGRHPRVQPPVRRVATARLGTYQSLACVAWTRVHLVNLTTGKVLVRKKIRPARRSPRVFGRPTPEPML